MDVRLQKTVKIRERYTAIVGFEAFNLFNHSNHINYGNYGNFALSATTGSGPNAHGHPTSVSTEDTSLEYFGGNLQFFGRFTF